MYVRDLRLFTTKRIVLLLLGYKTTVCFAEIDCRNIQRISEDGSIVLCSAQALIPMYQIPRNHKPEDPII
jgi:hypothetical protein